MEDIKIKDVMTTNVITVDEKAGIAEAAEIMAKARVGSLVVTTLSGPVGIITESDIIKKIVGHKINFGTTTVGEAMNKPIIFATPDQNITDAASIMISNRIRRLPIVQNNKIVGMMTHTDIVRASPAMISLLEERLKMREPEANIPTREARVHIGSRAGICETCGKYSADLAVFDEDWCCERCSKERQSSNTGRRKAGFKDWSRMS